MNRGKWTFNIKFCSGRPGFFHSFKNLLKFPLIFFEQLSKDIAKKRSEAEEMERIRLELHLEEQEELARQRELDQMEKRIRQRLELQKTEAEQKHYKQMRKAMEKEEEENFKKQVICFLRPSMLLYGMYHQHGV